MLKLSVHFDLFTGNATYTDDTDYASDFSEPQSNIEGALRITHPDGLRQDVPAAASQGDALVFSVPLRMSDGAVMRGAYAFSYTARRVSDGTTVSSLTESVTFGAARLAPSVTLESDIFHAMSKVLDATPYAREGYGHTLLSRYMEYVSAAGMGHSGTGTLDLAPFGNLVTGDHHVLLSASARYAHGNGWFFWSDKTVLNTTISIQHSIMLPDLIELIRRFSMKLVNADCCRDSSHGEMLADYGHLSALYTSFVNSGQAGVTTGLEDIRDEMLSLIKKWCAVDTSVVEGTPVSDYEFCLCSPGGPSARFTYNAGNGAQIVASATGVTFAITGGVGEFTYPAGGATIYGGTITGDAADATYSMNGVTDSFKLVLATPSANAAYASLLASIMAVIGTENAGGIADVTPLVYDSGAIQKYVTKASDNKIEIVLGGVGATYSTGWALAFQLP